LGEMKTTGVDTHNLAEAAAKQAAAVETNNARATAALDASIEASRRDQRAWVEIEPIKAIFVSPAADKFGAVFKYQIYPKNIGRTAAYDLILRAQNLSSDDR